MPTIRAELPVSDTWRLEDIYPSNVCWEQEYADVSGSLETLSAFSGHLHDRSVLLDLLTQSFETRLRAEKLYVYAKMRRDEDNNAAVYQALVDRAQALDVSLSATLSFLAPELLALPEADLLSAAESPGFAPYRAYLRALSRQRPHTLSAKEERIVAMAGELGAAPDTIYSLLTDADMKYQPINFPDGTSHEVTQGSFIPLMMNREQSVREAAFASLYEGYKAYSATIPAIYAASVKADLFSSRTANFESALGAALFPDEIPTAVYDNLIEIIHRHLPGLNRLVMLNARQNGIEHPSMVDLYVPVSLGFDVKLPFDEAYELMCDCLSVLGEDYLSVLHTAKQERWIDPFETSGKSSGAYSWGTYDTHPYVLLNYHEDLDGLLTLAHEMGHSLHSHLSNQNQPYPTAGYSLFVAEVASTVNEVLVLLELLDRHPSKAAQAYLLHNLLDGFRTTVFRQTMFAEFERESHRLAEMGEALTGESLNTLYGALNAKYYHSIRQNPLIAYEWMRIPHFYSAFYVYKYATGFSIATAIARAIREQGTPAVQKYKAFLSAGSSVPPIEALKLADIDMSTTAPIEQALTLFESLLDRYEAALD